MSGYSEKEAMKRAIYTLTETLDVNSKRKKFCSRYALNTSLLAFLFSLIISLIGIFTPDTLMFSSIIYPLFFIIFLGVLIFTFITKKKRTLIDFLIVEIIFVSIFVITIQCVLYFYRASTGNFYYSLFYQFPGVLKFNTHVLISMTPTIYEINNTILLFDPTLLVTFFSVSVNVFLLIIKKQNKIM